MDFISSHKNIGPRSGQWLSTVGITTMEDLRRLGPVDAYLKVKEKYPDDVTENMLWALYGVIHNLDWSDVPDVAKKRLRMEVKDKTGE